jgi:hypothetical protein
MSPVPAGPARSIRSAAAHERDRRSLSEGSGPEWNATSVARHAVSAASGWFR